MRTSRSWTYAVTATALAGTAIVMRSLLLKRRQSGANGKLETEPAIGVVTINAPKAEVFRVWRAAGSITRLMPQGIEVREAPDGTMQWSVRSGSQVLEWTTRIVSEVPDEVVTWRSGDDSAIPASGEVRFQELPPGRGTRVTLALSFAGGWATRALAPLARIAAREALRRLRQLVETGEIASTEGQSSGRERGTSSAELWRQMAHGGEATTDRPVGAAYASGHAGGMHR